MWVPRAADVIRLCWCSGNCTSRRRCQRICAAYASTRSATRYAATCAHTPQQVSILMYSRALASPRNTYPCKCICCVSSPFSTRFCSQTVSSFCLFPTPKGRGSRCAFALFETTGGESRPNPAQKRSKSSPEIDPKRRIHTKYDGFHIKYGGIYAKPQVLKSETGKTKIVHVPVGDGESLSL